MTSGAPGKNTSTVEVTHTSQHGFWLLLGDKELFLSFEKFPWFRDAGAQAIHHVEWPQPHHLYWPELDIDLAVETIEHPENFPLVSEHHR